MLTNVLSTSICLYPRSIRESSCIQVTLSNIHTYMFQGYDVRHCVEKFWDTLLQLCWKRYHRRCSLYHSIDLKSIKHFKIYLNACTCCIWFIWNKIMKRNTCMCLYKSLYSKLYKKFLKYNICAEDNLIIIIRNYVN